MKLESINSKQRLFAILAITLGAIGLAFFLSNHPQVAEKNSADQDSITTASEKRLHSSPQKEFATSKIPSYQAYKPAPDALLSNRDVDDDSLYQYSRNLTSGTEDERLSAMKVLSEIGTKEQKAVIERFARDKNASTAIQLTALERIDWNENIDFLGQTIQRNDEIAEATIIIATGKDLPQETRTRVDEAVYVAFLGTQRPSTQIAILDYFSEQHSDKFDELSARINLDDYTAEEKQDVFRLLSQRSEDLNLAASQ
jgi:NAD-dependent DNA ligase